MNFIDQMARELTRKMTVLKVYFDPSQPRAEDGKWTDHGEQSGWHANKADSLKNGNSKKRHLATALAAAALHSMSKGQSPTKHIADMAKVVEALRVQVHHAKNGKKAHTAAQIQERQDAYDHYRVMLQQLKDHAAGKGPAPKVSHFDGDLDDEDFKAKEGGKSIAAASKGQDAPAHKAGGTKTPAAAPAPAPEPAVAAVSPHAAWEKEADELASNAKGGSSAEDAALYVAHAHKMIQAGDHTEALTDLANVKTNWLGSEGLDLHKKALNGIDPDKLSEYDKPVLSMLKGNVGIDDGTEAPTPAAPAEKTAQEYQDSALTGAQQSKGKAQTAFTHLMDGFKNVDNGDMDGAKKSLAKAEDAVSQVPKLHILHPMMAEHLKALQGMTGGAAEPAAEPTPAPAAVSPAVPPAAPAPAPEPTPAPAAAPAPLPDEKLGIPAPGEHAAAHKALLQLHTTAAMRGNPDSHIMAPLAMAHHWAGVATKAANDGKDGKAKMALHMLDEHLTAAHQAGQDHGGNPEQGQTYDDLKGIHDKLAKHLGAEATAAPLAVPPNKPVEDWTQADHDQMAAHIGGLPEGPGKVAAYQLHHGINMVKSAGDALGMGDTNTAQSNLKTAGQNLSPANLPDHLWNLKQSASHQWSKTNAAVNDADALNKRSGAVGALSQAIGKLPMSTPGNVWTGSEHQNATKALNHAAALTTDGVKKAALEQLAEAHGVLAYGDHPAADAALSKVKTDALPQQWQKELHLKALDSHLSATLPGSKFSGIAMTHGQHNDVVDGLGKAAAAYHAAGHHDQGDALTELAEAHNALSVAKEPGGDKSMVSANMLPDTKNIPESYQSAYDSAKVAADHILAQQPAPKADPMAAPQTGKGDMSASDHDNEWKKLDGTQFMLPGGGKSASVSSAIDDLKNFHAVMEDAKSKGKSFNQGEGGDLHNVLNDATTALSDAMSFGEHVPPSVGKALADAAAEHHKMFGQDMNEDIQKVVDKITPPAPAAPVGTAPPAGTGKWSWGRYGYDSDTHKALGKEMLAASGKHSGNLNAVDAIDSAGIYHGKMAQAQAALDAGDTATAQKHMDDVKSDLVKTLQKHNGIQVPEAQAALKSAAGAFNAMKDANPDLTGGKVFLGKKGKKGGPSTLMDTHAWKLGQDNSGTAAAAPAAAAPAAAGAPGDTAFHNDQMLKAQDAVQNDSDAFSKGPLTALQFAHANLAAVNGLNSQSSKEDALHDAKNELDSVDPGNLAPQHMPLYESAKAGYDALAAKHLAPQAGAGVYQQPVPTSSGPGDQSFHSLIGNNIAKNGGQDASTPLGKLATAHLNLGVAAGAKANGADPAANLGYAKTALTSLDPKDLPPGYDKLHQAAVDGLTAFATAPASASATSGVGTENFHTAAAKSADTYSHSNLGQKHALNAIKQAHYAIAAAVKSVTSGDIVGAAKSIAEAKSKVGDMDSYSTQVPAAATHLLADAHDGLAMVTTAASGNVPGVTPTAAATAPAAGPTPGAGEENFHADQSGLAMDASDVASNDGKPQVSTVLNKLKFAHRHLKHAAGYLQSGDTAAAKDSHDLAQMYVNSANALKGDLPPEHAHLLKSAEDGLKVVQGQLSGATPVPAQPTPQVAAKIRTPFTEQEHKDAGDAAQAAGLSYFANLHHAMASALNGNYAVNSPSSALAHTDNELHSNPSVAKLNILKKFAQQAQVHPQASGVYKKKAAQIEEAVKSHVTAATSQPVPGLKKMPAAPKGFTPAELYKLAKTGLPSAINAAKGGKYNAPTPLSTALGHLNTAVATVHNSNGGGGVKNLTPQDHATVVENVGKAQALIAAHVAGKGGSAGLAMALHTLHHFQSALKAPVASIAPASAPVIPAKAAGGTKATPVTAAQKQAALAAGLSANAQSVASGYVIGKNHFVQPNGHVKYLTKAYGSLYDAPIITGGSSPALSGVGTPEFAALQNAQPAHKELAQAMAEGAFHTLTPGTVLSHYGPTGAGASTLAPAAPIKMKGNLAYTTPTTSDSGPMTVHDVDNVVHGPGKAMGGSNGAMMYTGKDGEKRVVKSYYEGTKAYGEHLTNKLYDAMGIPVAKTGLTTDASGKLLHVSDYLGDGPKEMGTNPSAEDAQEVLKGFAADTVLGNWDAVGLKGDNVKKAADGTVIRVDNGGSLLHRAMDQNGRKTQSQLDNLTELDNFQNGKNPTYTAYMHAAGVHDWKDIPGIKDQIDRMAATMTDAHIDKLTGTAMPGVPDADRALIAKTLKLRRDKMVALKPQIDAHVAKKAKDAAAAASNAALMASQPVSTPAVIKAAISKSGAAVQKLADEGKLPQHAAAVAYLAAKNSLPSQYAKRAKIKIDNGADVKAALSAMSASGVHSAPSVYDDAQAEKAAQIKNASTYTIGHHIHAANIPSLLDNGRIYTNFHGVNSAGGDDTKSRMETRSKVEATGLKMWNPQEGADTAAVYGVHVPTADSGGDVHHGSSHWGYGDIMAEFHPHVKDRAAFYNGDSLGSGGTTASGSKFMSADEAHIVRAAQEAQGTGPSTMQEGIIGGGVTLEDIRGFRAHGGSKAAATAKADILRQQLNDRGLGHLPIHIQYSGGGYSNGDTVEFHSGQKVN